MKTALSILKPEVKTKYLRNALMEKVRYLEIPKDVCPEDLKRDIKNGAVHMKELETLLKKKNDPKYIIITAQNEEQGLLAVSYLAACYNSIAGEDPDAYDEPTWDEEPDAPKILSDQDLMDLEDDEYEEEYWLESDRRIPILRVSEIIGATSPFETGSAFSFNNFQISQQHQNMNHRRRYWQDCTTRSVCITTGSGFNSLGMGGMEQLFDALEFFRENQKVYILHIPSDGTGFGGEGFGIGFMDDPGEADQEDEEENSFIGYDERVRNHLILNFSADDVEIRLKKEKEKKYYKEVLRSHIVRSGMDVAKGFSYEKILNLILAMRSDKVGDLIEKIFRYALKDRNLPQGYQFQNEDFAFIDRFARTADVAKSNDRRSAKEKLMHDLVGMEQVKQQVFDVVNMLKFNKMRAAKGIKGSQYHNVHVMLGAPGTAKTTVAKLMGQIMMEEKLLKDNRFVCVNGAELKGMYVGHSAPKTKALFDKHDIIVIDEAYSLIDSNGEADCFSNEVLAQLAIELENHADDRLVIFAGYGGTDVSEKNNRMKLFLDANPGIKSRINSTFFFESYTAEEMLKIFNRIAKNENYKVQPGAEEDLIKYFEKRRTASNFGNGREARSLLEGSLLFMSNRLFSEKGAKKITVADMKQIRAEDIKQAIERAVTANQMQLGCQSNRVGFAL